MPFRPGDRRRVTAARTLLGPMDHGTAPAPPPAGGREGHGRWRQHEEGAPPQGSAQAFLRRSTRGRVSVRGGPRLGSLREAFPPRLAAAKGAAEPHDHEGPGRCNTCLGGPAAPLLKRAMTFRGGQAHPELGESSPPRGAQGFASTRGKRAFSASMRATDGRPVPFALRGHKRQAQSLRRRESVLPKSCVIAGQHLPHAQSEPPRAPERNIIRGRGRQPAASSSHERPILPHRRGSRGEVPAA
jgi:hypothetical protein